MASKFLVTGATGQQGGATARFLIKQNATVHALVRNQTSTAAQSLKELGVILFKGDFDNVMVIQEATAGVSGIFLNPCPTKDPAAQVKQAQNFIDAAVAAKTVKTIVLSTAFFTGTPSIWDTMDPKFGLQAFYNGKLSIEEAVKAAGLEHYTILRPASLMHNYLLPLSAAQFPELAKEGTLAHMYKTETTMSHLDATDVGKFAAAALLNPEKFSKHEIEMGSENLTIEETAETLTRVSGIHVNVRQRSEEEVQKLWNKIPALRFQVMANERDTTIDGKALAEKYGITLMTFEEYLQREKEGLIKSLPKENSRTL